MNKLLRTTLITAILATSGFASETINNDISAGAKFNVQGDVTANIPISVKGRLNIEGGTLTNNNIIITYENTGSLLISSVFQPGDLKGIVQSIYEQGTSTDSNLNLNNFNKLNDKYWEFCVTNQSGEVVERYPISEWSDSSAVSIKRGYFTNSQPLTSETYEQAIQNARKFDLADKDITINWTDTSEASINTGTLTQNSTANSAINATSYAECFPTQGVLDFTKASSSGTFTGGPIQGGTVKLSHLGKTTAGFMAMSASDIVGVYEYNKGETEFVETIVNDEKYIVAEKTGDDETYKTTAKEAFKSRFNKQVEFADIETNFYAFGDDDTEVGDKRKNFTGIVGSSCPQNESGNILSTDNIKPQDEDENMSSALVHVTKNEATDAKILSVSRPGYTGRVDINFSFEGADNLEFQDTPGDSKRFENCGKLKFSGDNSNYTGTVSVSGVTQLTANGNNTLPHKLAEDFTETDLVIDAGDNTIDNASRGSATTIKSLQLNSGSLTIAPGTKIVIGNNL